MRLRLEAFRSVSFCALLLAASTPALSAVPNFGPGNEDPAFCRGIARDAIAKLGISAKDITESSIDIVQTINDITITTDVMVWFRVRQCSTGRLLIQMVQDCRQPRAAHGRQLKSQGNSRLLILKIARRPLHCRDVAGNMRSKFSNSQEQG